VGVKYVVVSRLSPEAIAEMPQVLYSVLSGGYIETRTHPLPLDEATKEMQRRQAQPLLILDGPDNVQKIGMMYAEVWIEDEAENRVTSPDKRVD